VAGKKTEWILNLKYLRLKLFHKIVSRVQPVVRGSRMAEFEKIFTPTVGSRVIDLGGTTAIWNLVKTPLDITIVNLPGTNPRKSVSSHHHFTFIEGDATQLHDYPDNSFDIVFSNSVIEHVGGAPKEREFANEARRLAPSYYVQTPSVYFPLEAHTGMPFWWAMPRFLRARMHRRWEKTLPDWHETGLGTTVITRRQLQSYFPDGAVHTERFVGIPKSYYVYRKARLPPAFDRAT